MREAVYRFAAPLLDRIPDISQQPVKRQAAIGVTVSLLFHLLVLLGLMIAAMVLPEHKEIAPAAKKELEIQLVQMPKKLAHDLAKPTPAPFLDPRGLEASKEKPKDTEFESDRDMVAGSESKPTGLLPMPSQEGVTNRNSYDFATRDVHLSAVDGAASRPPAPPSNPSPSASKETAERTPAMPPLYDPNPVSREKLDQAKNAKPNQKLPEPAKPRDTPRLKTSVRPREDEVAVAKPSDTADGPITKVVPVPQPVAKADLKTATPAPRYASAAMATPAPLSSPSYKERYQEELQKTRVEGNISNHGPPGANTVNTPLGRYNAQVRRAPSSSWYMLEEQRQSLYGPGSATLHFTVKADGHVKDISLESNTSNSSFETMCEDSVRAAPIPKIPDELLPLLPGGELDLDMTYTLYPIQ
ncbi:MAG TPA: hypothetical protein VGH90_08325 [Chthoniobacteraceae bacterium]